MTGGNLHRSAASLRRVLPGALWRPLRAVATGALTPLRFSISTGHWKSSLAMSARSAADMPTPWYTYPAIDFLRQRDFSGHTVLEFGGGQSTLWWSARARSVLTIEENAERFARLVPRIGANVALHNVPIDPTTQPLLRIRSVIEESRIRKFDVIVVDGHLRRALTAMAFDYLAPGGAIILDDAEGYGFQEEIAARNCRRIDFFGFAPGVVLRHCTSLVFVGDCFLLHPAIPIPVIENVGH